MLNKIGPKNDPSGTPFKRADQELKYLSIIFPCQRLDIKLFISSNGFFENL